MKWSWRLVDILGIGVYMHATFLLLIAWVVLIHWMEGQNLTQTLEGVAFILALFVCVVLHELGHALTAKKYGIRTRDITLLPIGGLARLERMPDDPKQELWVALAGPAVNVVIAAGLSVWLDLVGSLETLGGRSLLQWPFLARLMAVNVLLVAFNMVPAFPMDGGRVLRAILATRMDYTKATEIAASLGQGIALLFGFVGFFTNPFLMFIALFVWIGAGQEASMVQIRSALGGIPVSRAMVTDFRALSSPDALSRAVELILSGSQHDFPVIQDRQVVGILTRQNLLLALARQDLETPVADVMQQDFQVVDPSEMLETAFEKLQGCDCRTLPVVRRGEVVGLVTMDNVGEFISIQTALATTERRSDWHASAVSLRP